MNSLAQDAHNNFIIQMRLFDFVFQSLENVRSNDCSI